MNDEQRRVCARSMMPGNDLRIAHIPYDGPDGTVHFLSGAFYGFVRDAFPYNLPLLLPKTTCLYEIKDSPGKGKGLFTTHAIEFGQVIVVERPLIITPLVTCEQKGPEFPAPHGIMSSNGIEIDLKGGTEAYGGVFPITSSVNHSLFATRNIAPATEITASYLDLSWSRAKRLYELNCKYHFACTCPYCDITDPSSVDSDLRRREITNWYSKNHTYKKWLADPKRNRDTLIKSSLRVLVMIEKEGVEGEFAYRHYLDLARCYGVLADAKNMKGWGEKFILVDAESSSKEGRTLVDVWKGLLLNTQKFRHWGRAVKKSRFLYRFRTAKLQGSFSAGPWLDRWAPHCVSLACLILGVHLNAPEGSGMGDTLLPAQKDCVERPGKANCSKGGQRAWIHSAARPHLEGCLVVASCSC
ncbi:hypothetical protein K439DRAFT_1625483 [Ramaria rubella]|nr:hypothetical protein K439DRAFT_1625483 [Ramaria rubella]